MPVPAAALTVSTGGRQCGRGTAQHGQRPGELVLRQGRRLGIDVGLVDDDDVGQLDDPSLDRLQVVARVGQLEQHEDVDHAGHGRLRLAHAHGLDEDHVEAGRLAHQHRLAGLLAPRRPASRATARGG